MKSTTHHIEVTRPDGTKSAVAGIGRYNKGTWDCGMSRRTAFRQLKALRQAPPPHFIGCTFKVMG